MMPSARHILIVNSRSVHQPVFVVGAPHSGAELIGRALKAAPGFPVTIGQPSVLRTVYAFARRPSMYQGRTQAAATVIRDAFAQGWQVTASSCLECTRECRAAAGLAADAVGPCVELRGLETFGDGSPDLIYCAEALTYAFPDARIIQVIRDGRDVVASMLADPVVMSWYRPSFVNVDTEFPNPFFGHRTGGAPRSVAPAVPRRPLRAALALVRAAGRPPAPQPAVRSAEDDPLRAPAEQAGGGRGRPVPFWRALDASGRDPHRGPPRPGAQPQPPRPRIRDEPHHRGHHPDREDRRRGAPTPRLRPLGRLAGELGVVQVGVQAALGEELLVGGALGGLAGG